MPRSPEIAPLTVTLLSCCLLASLLVPPPAEARRERKEQPWQAAPSPADDAIYFVLVDRFANGDPANDGEIDLADPQAWHGGDLRGVLQQLDEIEALGVRTVWLSPVFDCRDAKFFAWGAFHGYWVEDYGAIDPRFGTVEDLRALSDALHARGMRLLLDVVFNHVAMDAALLAEHPDWFHETCDIVDWDDPRQLTDCRVHGLPDLAQENEAVYQHLLQTSRMWIDTVRPDGFRIDAVRHMPNAFLKRFAADVRAHAGPGFQLLGEDFEGDALKLSRSFRDGGFTSMFDFPLHYAMLDVYCADRPVGRIAATLSADREYDDAGALVPFLDNHDRPRLASACGGSRDAIHQALTFLLTARGTPSLTYGTESGLEGDGEPDNRADMRFEPRHATRDHIARVLALRRAHPSLQRGATRIVTLEPELLVLARIVPDEVALIAVHRGDVALQWAIPDALLDPTDDVIDLLSGHRWGGYALSLPPRSTQLFVLTADDEGGFAGLLDGPGEPGTAAAATRPVEVIVPATAAPADTTLALVGNGPRLGNWDPGQALRGFTGSGDDRALTFDAPVGAVLEFKLIRLAADGTVTWQPGENHYVFVAAGDGPLEIRPRAAFRIPLAELRADFVAAFDAGDLPGALAIADRCVAEHPDDWFSHNARGAALRMTWRLDEARGAFLAGIEHAGGRPGALCSSHRNLGLLQRRLGAHDEAIASFERARELCAAGPSLYALEIATTRAWMGQRAEAGAAFEALLPSVEDAEAFTAAADRGTVLLTAAELAFLLDRDADAVRLGQAAVHARDTHAVRLAHATYLAHAGRGDEAAARLADVDLDACSPEEIAAYHVAAGDLDTARRVLQEAHEALDPEASRAGWRRTFAPHGARDRWAPLRDEDWFRAWTE